MNENGKRLIEDYLPIEAISREASREKSVRKGHISTLHLWWARRPLVACRAAIYGALVPASRFAPRNGPEEKRASLTRANAAKFVDRLCKYPGDARTLDEARKHILEAHAERLSEETGDTVTVADIEQGRAPRPKVLDMFAGGGAIPLEALRLGCDAYALDLNPVAHFVQLCTLVYPQQFGKPESRTKGTARDGTWAGLADEVKHWGNWVLEKVRGEIGDLYPPISDPNYANALRGENVALFGKDETPRGMLTPVAYLWTRTVTCKNPSCKATVPLVRQTWLCKKKGRYVALKMHAPRGAQDITVEVVEATTEVGLGFDPAAFSKGGNATCPFCGTVADTKHVRQEGMAGRLGQQLLAVVCSRPGSQGKVYLAPQALGGALPDEVEIATRLAELCTRSGLTVPSEPMPKVGALGFRVQPYGFRTWADLFTSRQMLALLTFVAAIRDATTEVASIHTPDRTQALASLLAAMLDKLADFSSTLCVWNYTGGRGVKNSFGRHAVPMTWDFSETCPFNPAAASWPAIIADAPAAISLLQDSHANANVSRGSAVTLPYSDATLDSIITDPPYYDNVPYADISDFFYIWLKRTVGHLYPEHFASETTPKKSEAVADASRHGGSRARAKRAYEDLMALAFREAQRVLKPAGQMVVVYAHKTTLGWATLVEAMRCAGFTVTEAWPLDTEKRGRLRSMDSAALASSIFLVARKRDTGITGRYDTEVRPDLERIVRERVNALWEQGISGADLVIASVGAGLRAFTRFACVEYANGEEVPAERFLTEVETVVLETILARLSKETGTAGRTSLAGLDAATRFYVLWRYTYKDAELEAGEAIIFANGTHVELDGSYGLTSGVRALVEKKKTKYRLRDYTERGDDEKLGMPAEDGASTPPVVDALHRALWLMENRPRELPDFLHEARPSREQMRLVAQALAGPALKGGELGDVSPTGELAALAKLTANWRIVIEDAVTSPAEREARRTGQGILFPEGDRR